MGDGAFLPPPLRLKLGFADGLQKLCEWGNFLLCVWILNVVVTSPALLFILQRFAIRFFQPSYMVTISYWSFFTSVLPAMTGLC